MYCGKCGILNLERAKFCRDCGADMSFERNRGTIDNIFFVTLSCIMLGLIAFSLIYYAIRPFDDVEQKLDGINYCIYNKM